jgi:hypothetical protein
MSTITPGNIVTTDNLGPLFSAIQAYPPNIVAMRIALGFPVASFTSTLISSGRTTFSWNTTPYLYINQVDIQINGVPVATSLSGITGTLTTSTGVVAGAYATLIDSTPYSFTRGQIIGAVQLA